MKKQNYNLFDTSIVKLFFAIIVASSLFASCGVKKGCGCPSNINGAYKSAR